MKLKEKLAHEAQLSWNLRMSQRRDLPKPNNEYEHGFLAGFEKAKSMAIDNANDNCIETDYEVDLSTRERQQKEADTQYNLGCWETACSMAKIGEEEA